MRNNFYDGVKGEISDIVQGILGEIHGEFKKSKPFDKEPMDNNEMIIEYNMLEPQDLDAMAEQHGFDSVVKYIEQMESLKQGRQKHGR